MVPALEKHVTQPLGGQASPTQCQSQARINGECWHQEGHLAIKVKAKTKHDSKPKHGLRKH